MSQTKKEFTGGCHCGAVRFSTRTRVPLEIEDCNCSVCYKGGGLFIIVPQADFTLEEGGEHLSSYSFNTGVAKHTFCRHCGIKPFYNPRSNPDCVSVNARCLDGEPPAMQITPFDGQNWEANVYKLAHKNKG